MKLQRPSVRLVSLTFVFALCSTTSSSNTTQQNAGPIASASPAGGPSTWLDGLHSPLIQEDGGDKKLKLRFDVSQYAPEEIVVKTVDNKLLVSTIQSCLEIFCLPD